MSAAFDTPPIVETSEPVATESPSRLAGLLRWLGTGALALAAVVFLLQGLEDLDTMIRTYAYLLLIGALTACGIGTRTLFEDARSTRLLLGLAVALVPIQFAQLGGMLHSLASGEASGLGELFGFHALSAGTVGVVAGATVLLTPLAAFTGFAVLVRPAARLLTFVFVLQNLLLLLPWRDSLGGFAVLACLGAVAPLLDHALQGMQRRFATPEGRAVRAMLLVPLAIATVRLGFHIEAVTGLCALLAFWSAALIYIGRHHVESPSARELLYLPGALLAQLAWLGWVLLALMPDRFIGAVALVPAAAIFLAVARLSTFATVYRLFATTCLAAAALTLVLPGETAGALLGLGLGLATLLYGYWRRDRSLVMAGPVITLMALAVLVLEAVVHVEVNSWVTLSAAGVLLVVGASAVERFGTTLVVRARHGWEEIRHWD